jgi:hypothetical protein
MEEPAYPPGEIPYTKLKPNTFYKWISYGKVNGKFIPIEKTVRFIRKKANKYNPAIFEYDFIEYYYNGFKSPSRWFHFTIEKAHFYPLSKDDFIKLHEAFPKDVEELQQRNPHMNLGLINNLESMLLSKNNINSIQPSIEEYAWLRRGPAVVARNAAWKGLNGGRRKTKRSKKVRRKTLRRR